MKSIKVGQEGGTNQVKMIKIDTANGCSPPVVWSADSEVPIGNAARLHMAFNVNERT